jgi:CubicO group peptidase (beta-lactamase class C family)
MCTPQRTRDGKATSYGLGIGFKALDGARLVQHSGSQNKTATLLVMDPERQLVIALMSNSYGARHEQTAAAIWRAVRVLQPGR